MADAAMIEMPPAGMHTLAAGETFPPCAANLLAASDSQRSDGQRGDARRAILDT